jgi:DNA polymerase-3 subunit alpha
MTEKTQARFVHLHNHTEYSLLDGALRIDDMVKTAAGYRMAALAITDHGNMFGAIEFYKTAQSAGVKPIIGMETYVAPYDRRERQIHSQIAESSFHLTLLCQNEDGYNNLIKLASAAYLEGFYYRPRIDKELLAQHAKGLIALSGCWKGEVSYYIMRGDLKKAKDAISQYLDILGRDNFYLEVQDLGMKESKKVITAMLALGTEFGIPVVATNDCHYLRREDSRPHDVLLCIQTGKKLSERTRLKFDTQEIYFKSPAEMAELFSEVPETVTNSLQVAERCNLLLDLSGRRFHLPEYPRPPEFVNDFEYLSALAKTGFIHRYHRITPALEERFNYELSVIRKMGFSGYFLIAKDIVDFARRSGIPVGPGRGSTVGSLVLYALGIINVDPLQYGLIFERFLNPDRVSLPDVDIDFADTRRGEVIAYIRERYGSSNVAQIITFGTMQAKGVVRDVGRVLEIPYSEADRIAKLIPFGSSLDEALTTSPDLKALIESKPEYEELIAIAKKLEGLARHASIHASGVVIAPKPLTEFVSLYKNTDGDISTQYDMTAIDAVGLLKMDILGLRTLTVIDETIKILQVEGKTVNWDEIPLTDEKTYQLLQSGETVGVFQLESFGMRDILRKFKPTQIEELIAVISLYRPGPLGSVNINEFIHRRHGHTKVTYPHPLLEDVLKETYGIILYQEQVMQIAAIIGGFSMSQADQLRRAMAKKVPELMAQMRELFVDGAKKKKIAAETAEKVFDLITPFAGYGFNKSHSAGYAHLSYQTAYLKANYPREFICANLTSEIGDSDKLYKFINEARRLGIKVLPPDVNRSQYQFTIEDGAIRFGLAGVKNVGQGAAEMIARERVQGEFHNLFDFLKRTKTGANRKCVESLVKAGAFDAFDPNRHQLLEVLESELAKANSDRLEFLEKQTSFFETAKKESRPKKIQWIDLLPYEKEAFGFYFSGHPLEKYKDQYQALSLATSSELEQFPDDGQVSLGGVVIGRKVKRDRKDREYCILTLEDFEGAVEVFVFSELYDRTKKETKLETPLIVKGRVSHKEGEKPKLSAQSLLPFSEAHSLITSMVVELNLVGLDETVLLTLKERLVAYPGACSVFFHIHENQKEKGNNSKKKVIRLREMKVMPTAELINELRELVGVEAVYLHGSV